MRMQPRQFRIGELAQALGVERFVVRFWEKEFGLRSTRSEGGQRFYEERDLTTFKLIKKLLYEDGLTIAGAKKVMRDKATITTVVPSHITTMEPEHFVESAPEEHVGCTPENCKLREQFDQLKDQLIRLKKILLKVQFQPAETLTASDEFHAETQLSVPAAAATEPQPREQITGDEIIQDTQLQS